MLMVVADMIILNVLYILCCVPIFTIGASQAGLFTGMRVLLDPEDDSPVTRAFFRGFSNGFSKITKATLVFFGLLVLLYFLLFYILIFRIMGGSSLPVILCGIAMGVVYVLQCMSAPFHATFDCSTRQLLRNSLLVTLANPIQAIVSAVLIALPAIISFFWFDFFLSSLFVLLTIYYSIAYLLCLTLLKKPFQRLKDLHAARDTADGEESAEMSESL